MNPTVIVALIGVVSAVTAALVNGALAVRSQAGEDVRAARLRTYPEVWELTSHVSRWPENSLTYQQAADWHLAMRQWYYSSPQVGGMYLSEFARARYGDVQQLLALYLQAVPENADAAFPAKAYDALREASSAFRTALTEDLQSRRYRSLIWVTSRALLHRRLSTQGRKRLNAARIESSE